MALTNQPVAIKAVQTIGLVSMPILHGGELASSTYKAGAALIDDATTGYLTEVSGPVDGSTAAKRTLGFAESTATGTTGADVRFVPAWPSVVFEGTLSNSNAGTHTLAQSDQWKTFPITKATANWYLDTSNASVTTITATAEGGLVVGLKDAVGTTDGRVYFVVTALARGPVANTTPVTVRDSYI